MFDKRDECVGRYLVCVLQIHKSETRSSLMFSDVCLTKLDFFEFVVCDLRWSVCVTSKHNQSNTVERNTNYCKKIMWHPQRITARVSARCAGLCTPPTCNSRAQSPASIATPTHYPQTPATPTHDPQTQSPASAMPTRNARHSIAGLYLVTQSRHACLTFVTCNCSKLRCSIFGTSTN